MRKALLLIALVVSVVANAQQRQISYVETSSSGSWYQVYDTNGKKITTLARQSVGELIGWSAEIIVTKSGSWYKILSPEGKNLKTMSEQTVGTVISVSGNTFTCRSGNWITIRDKTGRIISTRPAN